MSVTVKGRITKFGWLNEPRAEIANMIEISSRGGLAIVRGLLVVVRRCLVTAALCIAILPIYRTGAAEFSSSQPDARPQYRLGPQDKVSIRVYEWRPARDEIYEWSAFKAEYIVNAGGSLSLPLLGEVPAEGFTITELARSLGDRLKDRMGLIASPDVTAEVVQFRPFYIVGAVDKPGEYSYRPGLTVLEAYAIAGGKPRNALGAARLGREAIATRGDLNALSLETQNLVARMARLQAELANASTVTWPTELQARMDSGPLSRTIKQETLVFNMHRESFKTQISSLEQLQSYLEQEATSLEKQLDVHKIEIESVKAEYDMVEKLYQKGLTSVPRKLVLQRNMAQADGDRLKLESSLMRARQEISKTRIAIVDLQAKRSSDISTDMQTTQSRLDELKSRMETSTKLLYDTEVEAPRVLDEKGADSLAPVFDVMRRDAPNLRERNVSQNTAIRPGDTIFVEQPRPENRRDDTSALRSDIVPTPATTATVSATSDRLR